MRGHVDNRGIFELPVQYMIAVIVAGISIALIGMAAHHVWRDHQVHTTIKEVNKIVEEAERMCMTADEGTLRHLYPHFPASMEKAVFGSPDAPNHYYMLMKWGENKSFFSPNANFMGENAPQAILYPGVDTIILELIYEEGETYVKITTPS